MRAPNIVVHIDYSEDSSVIQTNCKGMEIIYYDVNTCTQIKTTCKDLNWTTWTCPRGWPVQGIEDNSLDQTAYLSVDRCLAGDTLATGDTNGLVKLFRHPCPSQGIHKNKYLNYSIQLFSISGTCIRGI